MSRTYLQSLITELTRKERDMQHGTLTATLTKRPGQFPCWCVEVEDHGIERTMQHRPGGWKR